MPERKICGAETDVGEQGPVRCREQVDHLDDEVPHRWWRGGQTWDDREYGVEWRDGEVRPG